MKKTVLSLLMLLIFLLGGCATQAPQTSENENETTPQATSSSDFKEETGPKTVAPSENERRAKRTPKSPKKLRPNATRRLTRSCNR